ncbi:MAG: helix-turn-helix domain-containing protein [Ktedonobacterales bacterium]|nr:helix-turn-helix domain-containing protein [Ktedonobacterales bacterium]
MIVMDGEEFLTAQEACEILGIKPATLYAYVSRGVLGSYRQGIKRTRLYRRDEVERLIRLRGPDEHDAEVDGSADPPAWIPYV